MSLTNVSYEAKIGAHLFLCIFKKSGNNVACRKVTMQYNKHNLCPSVWAIPASTYGLNLGRWPYSKCSKTEEI